MSDEEILRWIYARLVNVHHEHEKQDYMLRFRQAITNVRDQSALDAAVAAEREQCAKMCENLNIPAWVETTGDMREALAEAIRGK